VPGIYAAVREAMVDAGVDEDKVDGPASDLSAAIENSIRKPVDELRFYGEVALASLVPLWVIALVVLFRHQRERVDLSHLEWVVRQANLVASERDYDAPVPFDPTPGKPSGSDCRIRRIHSSSPRRRPVQRAPADLVELSSPGRLGPRRRPENGAHRPTAIVNAALDGLGEAHNRHIKSSAKSGRVRAIFSAIAVRACTKSARFCQSMNDRADRNIEIRLLISAATISPPASPANSIFGRDRARLLGSYRNLLVDHEPQKAVGSTQSERRQRRMIYDAVQQLKLLCPH
jgi:hypothetical protein